jgi:hypothetical protein
MAELGAEVTTILRAEWRQYQRTAAAPNIHRSGARCARPAQTRPGVRWGRRPLIAVDEQGQEITGDHIMAFAQNVQERGG